MSAALRSRGPGRPSRALRDVAPPAPLNRSVWRTPDFLLLWVAQAISQTAQNAIWYGIVVLVQERSNSSTLLSVAILTLILPSVLVGVLAGVYVDRWDKRWVLIGTNLARGVVALSYALFGAALPLSLAWLFLVNFVFSTIGQFFAPAETAMIPAVVSPTRLLQANSLFHLTLTASQLIGLVILGPLLVKIFGVQALFLGMAVAIIICGGLVWPLPSHRGLVDPRHPTSGREALLGVWRDVHDVGRFVLADRTVALSMAQWTIGAILGLVVATLMPGFASHLLHVRAEDAVFVIAPAGVGMVGGVAALNAFGARLDKAVLPIVGLSVVSAALLAIGTSVLGARLLVPAGLPLIFLAGLGHVSVLTPAIMALALVAGVGFVCILVPCQTVLHERAPVELRGRVFAVELMLSNLATIVPLLLLGGLADLIGADVTVDLLGVLLAVAAGASVYLARPGERQAAVR